MKIATHFPDSRPGGRDVYARCALCQGRWLIVHQLRRTARFHAGHYGGRNQQPGQAVGFSTAANGAFNNFVRNVNGSFTTLSFADSAEAMANGLNVSGQVVGGIGSTAFFLTNGGNTVIPASFGYRHNHRRSGLRDQRPGHNRRPVHRQLNGDLARVRSGQGVFHNPQSGVERRASLRPGHQ